ncbi:hypothetical protein Pmi06nite_47860 [Planotetraspora mira]|uniref:Tyr recombinase domain-containing protein n=1 Tax=Planotetraspora mira TaxID=58121 RepID=A0A8J3TSI0_9ACTN|nr:hypothetical protein Pmi06nite_47860 [Planotetraspora mira]
MALTHPEQLSWTDTAGPPDTTARVDHRSTPAHLGRPDTAMTLLLEQGVDIRVVQVILDHSQLPTTKRCMRLTETLAGQAAARMGRALWDN